MRSSLKAVAALSRYSQVSLRKVMRSSMLGTKIASTGKRNSQATRIASARPGSVLAASRAITVWRVTDRRSARWTCDQPSFNRSSATLFVISGNVGRLLAQIVRRPYQPHDRECIQNDARSDHKTAGELGRYEYLARKRVEG